MYDYLRYVLYVYRLVVISTIIRLETKAIVKKVNHGLHRQAVVTFNSLNTTRTIILYVFLLIQVLHLVVTFPS